jgi:hypothetical protein
VGSIEFNHIKLDLDNGGVYEVQVGVHEFSLNIEARESKFIAFSHGPLITEVAVATKLVHHQRNPRNGVWVRKVNEKEEVSIRERNSNNRPVIMLEGYLLKKGGSRG